MVIPWVVCKLRLGTSERYKYRTISFALEVEVGRALLWGSYEYWILQCQDPRDNKKFRFIIIVNNRCRLILQHSLSRSSNFPCLLSIHRSWIHHVHGYAAITVTYSRILHLACSNDMLINFISMSYLFVLPTSPAICSCQCFSIVSFAPSGVVSMFLQRQVPFLSQNRSQATNSLLIGLDAGPFRFMGLMLDAVTSK